MQVRQGTNMPGNAVTLAEQSPCRCRGTGAYTAEIPVSDAVVLIRRVCLDHLARRTRLKDTTTGRVGEVMEVNKAYGRVHLRPVGGGREWTANVGSLEPPAETA